MEADTATGADVPGGVALLKQIKQCDKILGQRTNWLNTIDSSRPDHEVDLSALADFAAQGASLWANQLVPLTSRTPFHCTSLSRMTKCLLLHTSVLHICTAGCMRVGILPVMTAVRLNARTENIQRSTHTCKSICYGSSESGRRRECTKGSCMGMAII